MDYEKAYKELVGKIKNAHLYALTDSTKNVLENILPELAESEDEKIRKGLVRLLKELLELGGVAQDEWDRNECEKYIVWLANQKPAEWSEEDEQHIDSLLKRLDALCRNKFERTRFAISEDRDWLKSIRPQNRWKPSDVQISLLQAIINEPNNAASESCQIVLKDILEQLKKLKEG